jgi:hypothetical protein
MRLTVRDTGVGIPRAVLPKLFRALYHQDHPEVGALGGSGLGLVIVKRNVERHHGSVSVRSRVGRGTIVDVTLPQRREQDVLKTALTQMIDRSRSERRSFSLLVLKSAGALYERLWRVLKDAIRSDDRYYPLQQAGLIALVARTNLRGAQVISERIQQRVQRDPELRRNRAVRLQLGIAAYPAHGRRASQLFKVAQAHLVPLAIRRAGRAAAG